MTKFSLSPFLSRFALRCKIARRSDKAILLALLNGKTETLTPDTKIDLWGDLSLAKSLLAHMPAKSATWLVNSVLTGQHALLFELAINSSSPHILQALLHNDKALSVISFEHAMHTVYINHFFHDHLPHTRLISLLLANIADTTLEKGAWGIDYTPGLMTWASDGHPGVIAWAHKSGLPVLDCLPLKEAISNAYGSIKETATFRLLLAISNASSSHAYLALRDLLDSAGNTPEECLFNPSPDFLQACMALPDVAHANARKRSA